MKSGNLKKVCLGLLLAFAFIRLDAQTVPWGKKFEQLETILPTANGYRTASGAPGENYWQQRADYDIQVTLNDQNQTIIGSEKITYYNNSPHTLKYLWLQLDQNNLDQDSDTPKISSSGMSDTIPSWYLQYMTHGFEYDGGFKIAMITGLDNKPLKYTINKTMMRVELPKPLSSGDNFAFRLSWSYNINDRMMLRERSGYEYFPEDDNYLYTIAQFYPRMCVYNDIEGWQNKQFLGNGEFTLNFGDFKMDITVPDDFIVAGSGVLQNANEVLSGEQQKRLEQARKSYDKPVFIINQEEAEENETTKSTGGMKTWTFKADNVRDVAFACSRKFIWDAQAVKLDGGNEPLAMSFYSKEGNPLWEQESTKAVVNTLKTYSRLTIDYPYPVAISVHTASIGMEYPMICFNFGRPEEDGTYTDRTKYGMIGVIIHEVGHNFFPMIINSDERQWTWMDEGLNTFCQYMTEKEHYVDFPHRRGPAKTIVNYMKGDKSNIRPIMTNSEQILQFGNNAYGKPAAALNVLREVVMGPELFDYAFKTYAERWAFKHPTPGDLFRTMEDASAIDLDWFWRGWFYTTDHVDIAIEDVKWYTLSDMPIILNKEKTETKNSKKKKSKKTNDEETSKASPFDKPQPFVMLDTYPRIYGEFKNTLDEDKIRASTKATNYYQVTLKNEGGLVMPLIIEWSYKDGTKEIEKIPAEIWKENENQVTKIFTKKKEVASISLDPNQMTADIDTTNNDFPRKKAQSAFDTYKDKKK